MENPLQNAIQKMGSNFLVAAFVPSMAFIIISSIAFDPMLPDEFRYLGDTAEKIVQSSLNLLLFTTILGYTLYTLSTYIYKTFEGYSSLLYIKGPLRRSFLRRQKRRYKKLILYRDQVERRLGKVQYSLDNDFENIKSGSWKEKRYERLLMLENELKDKRYTVIASLEENFPPSLASLMPTRFGNILKAAETYPVTRYRIDSVQLWGRLAHVIPEQGMEKLDHANNQSLFLLNSSLLAGLFIVICLFASLINAIALYLKQIGIIQAPLLHLSLSTSIYQERVFLYIILAVLAIGVAWLFYEASLLNVSQFGDMIRASYDLYRFELFKALHLPLPSSLEEERQKWNLISQFMVGNESFGKVNFTYEHSKELGDSEKK